MDWRLLVEECIANVAKLKEFVLEGLDILAFFFCFFWGGVNRLVPQDKLSVFANQPTMDSWRVSRWSNVRQLSRKLEQLDIIENATRIRPDTKWKPFLLTNVRYSVSLLNYVLGLGSVILPEFIKKSKAIIGLAKDWKTGKKYKDNLCLFRCYAIHQGYSKTKLKTPTKLYFMNWKKKTGQSVDCKNFKGVKLEKISTFEKIFKVNINIFRLNEEKIATPVYKSACKFFKNK